MSVQAHKLYTNYLWFKEHAESGIVPKRVLSKSRKQYWGKKLVGAGWIIDNGDSFSIRSYRHVWKMMGIKKVNKRNGTRGYRYAKIDTKLNSTYVKDTLQSIRHNLVDRKKQQIKRRLVIAGINKKLVNHQKPSFSCKAVARTLGYRSEASGHKYRDDYFDVIKSPLVLEKHLSPKGSVFFKYPCFKIHLNKIYA